LAKIAELNKRIDEMMKEVNSLIYTILGVSKVLAAIIVSETGNITRFKNPDKLVAYAGISPTTYRSRQYKTPIARMEKRGSRQLRYVIMQATEYAVRYCDCFARRMQKKRAEGKSYRVAISYVARNLLRMIYCMETTGEIYHAPAST
jgi:transposase